MIMIINLITKIKIIPKKIMMILMIMLMMTIMIMKKMKNKEMTMQIKI